jgi:hypothetical protein
MHTQRMPEGKTRPSTGESGRRLAFIAFLIWLPLVSGAMLLLGVYQAKPGDPGHPAEAWPEGLPLMHVLKRPTLLLFLHSECPCSRASVAALARLLSKGDGKVEALAIVRHTPGASASGPSALDAQLLAIPKLMQIDDPDGELARRFGVETSGHALLFRADGVLVYSGGLTPARGHEGDCLGLDALFTWLSRGRVVESRAPVYGCAIRSTSPKTRPRATR